MPSAKPMRPINPGLGNTGIVFAALKSGSIDVYPEYTGTISQELFKSKTPMDAARHEYSSWRRKDWRSASRLASMTPMPWRCRKTLAQKLGIKTLSDLAKHPELRLGLSQEFLKRADGWPGVKAAYGLPFAAPQGLDHGLAYDSHRRGAD